MKIKNKSGNKYQWKCFVFLRLVSELSFSIKNDFLNLFFIFEILKCQVFTFSKNQLFGELFQKRFTGGICHLRGTCARYPCTPYMFKGYGSMDYASALQTRPNVRWKHVSIAISWRTSWSDVRYWGTQILDNKWFVFPSRNIFLPRDSQKRGILRKKCSSGLNATRPRNASKRGQKLVAIAFSKCDPQILLL